MRASLRNSVRRGSILNSATETWWFSAAFCKTRIQLGSATAVGIDPVFTAKRLSLRAQG